MEATIGGTRRHLVDVARGQKARGLDVHLAVATARDPDFPEDLDALEREGVGVTRVPMVRRIAPRVREICDRHDVKYNVASLPRQAASVARRIMRLSFPD